MEIMVIMKKLLIILTLASLACQAQVKLNDGTIVTTHFIGGNAKFIQVQSTDSLTSIYSRQSFGEHNICIGRNAGATLTHQGYVVIIGDKSKIDTTKYHDYDIEIDCNWGFFKTCEGRELKGYLRAWQQGSFSGGEGALNIARQEHVEQLRAYLEENWIHKISAYYEKRQHRKAANNTGHNPVGPFHSSTHNQGVGYDLNGNVIGQCNTQMGNGGQQTSYLISSHVRIASELPKKPLQSYNNCKTTHLGKTAHLRVVNGWDTLRPMFYGGTMKYYGIPCDSVTADTKGEYLWKNNKCIKFKSWNMEPALTFQQVLHKKVRFKNGSIGKIVGGNADALLIEWATGNVSGFGRLENIKEIVK